LDIEDVRSFVAVAEYEGFRAAAEALYVAQPALSRRVRRLEHELGTQLFERHKRGVRLTPKGEAFLKGARRILDVVHDVHASVTGRWSEVIRLGCAGTAAGSFLASFLATWIPQHPEVYLMMIEDGAQALRQRLETRECDLAIIAAPIPDTYDHRLVTEVRLQALFPPGHPLGDESGPLSVVALHGERVLLNAPAFLSTALFMSACRVAGVEPKVVYHSNIGQTLAALAEAGLGIAIMGDSVDLRGFHLRRRPVCDHYGNPLLFKLHVAWLRERILPSAAYDLAEELASHVQSGMHRRPSGSSL